MNQTQKTDTLPSVIMRIKQDASEATENTIEELTAILSEQYSDWEILLVGDGLQSRAWQNLQRLADKHTNIQAYRLLKQVGRDAAMAVGLDMAIGDIAITYDNTIAPVAVVKDLLEAYNNGSEIVLALRTDRINGKTRSAYGWISGIFYNILGKMGKLEIPKGMTSITLLSRRAVKEMMLNADRHKLFPIVVTLLGLDHTTIVFSPCDQKEETSLGEAFGRANRFLILSTPHPLRALVKLSLAASVLNLFYSAYVLLVTLLRDDIASGWASLSLQVSGLFFLLFLILAAFGQLLSHVVERLQERPPFVVVDESSSLRMTRRETPNITLAETTEDMNAETDTTAH